MYRLSFIATVCFGCYGRESAHKMYYFTPQASVTKLRFHAEISELQLGRLYKTLKITFLITIL
jgi:hypothetical protein